MELTFDELIRISLIQSIISDVNILPRISPCSKYSTKRQSIHDKHRFKIFLQNIKRVFIHAFPHDVYTSV